MKGQWHLNSLCLFQIEDVSILPEVLLCASPKCGTSCWGICLSSAPAMVFKGSKWPRQWSLSLCFRCVFLRCAVWLTYFPLWWCWNRTSVFCILLQGNSWAAQSKWFAMCPVSFMEHTSACDKLTYSYQERDAWGWATLGCFLFICGICTLKSAMFGSSPTHTSLCTYSWWQGSVED